MTREWHPQIRELVAASDVQTLALFPIRTSVPIGAWRTTNVTLVGDAIHSMTPFRGIGGNLALRDAQLLCRELVAAHRGELPVVEAIHRYEEEMIRYGFAGVRASMRAARMSHSDNPLARVALQMILRTMSTLPPIRRHVSERRSQL